MKMADSEARLRQILINVANNCGLNRWHYKKTLLNETVENYMGEIVSVSIIGVKEEMTINLQLIVKSAPIEHQVRESGLLNRAYMRESYIYSKLFVDYKNLHTNININTIAPKYYFADTTSCKEVIVMENMCQKGFRTCQEKFLDVAHVKVALKTLANFHALSIILQEKDIEASNLHKTEIKPFGEEIHQEHLAYIRDVMNNTKQMFAETKYEPTIAKMLKEFDNELRNETKYSNITVFGHGDLWKNNILFQYVNDKPVQACLIDFQIARLANPAFDVLSILLNSVSTEVRSANYRDFISTYYDTLQICLCENGLEGTKIYNRAQFNEDLKVVTFLCFTFVQFSYTLWLGLEEGKLLDSKNPCQTEKQKQEKKNELKYIIKDIMDNLHSFGYLDI